MHSRIDRSHLTDLLWSPQVDDEFIAYGNELFMYQIKNLKQKQKNDLFGENTIQLCNQTKAELVAHYDQTPSVKLVAWHTGRDNPHLLALATGFDRIRNQHSILVWDVGNKINNELSRPIYETSLAETCNSISWHPRDENTLLAGLSGKSLRLVDLRKKSNAELAVNTKYVNSFSIDPTLNSDNFNAVSFGENVVAVWDLRNFTKPLTCIVEENNIAKIQWCPVKSGTLAVLTKNSSSLNVYSIKSVSNALSSLTIEDENAPKSILIDKITRDLPCCSSNKSGSNSLQSPNNNPNSLTNFCWYNFDMNKILVSNNYLLSKLSTLYLFDRVFMTWSPTGDFYWSSSLGLVNQIENLDKNEFDFLTEFKERTKLDYGLKYEIISIVNGTATSVASTHSTYNQLPVITNSAAKPLMLSLHSHYEISSLIRSDFNHNIKNCLFKNLSPELNNNVKYLWQWFDTINRFFEIILPSNPRNNTIDFPSHSRLILYDLYWTRYCGLKALLEDFIMKRPQNSELQQSHDDRFRIISYNLCGWDFKEGGLTKQFFTNLESNKQYERAACLAVMTHNFEQALEILDSASKNAEKGDSRFGYLWIALKYFQQEYQQQQQQQQQKEAQTRKLSTQVSVNSLSSPYSSPTLKSISSPSIQLSQSSLSSSNKSPFFLIHTSQSSETQTTTTSSTTTSTHSQNSNSSSDDGAKECNQIINNFDNPYLKALFTYVLNRDESIMKILAQLQQYFEYLIEEECLKNADLHGILLTGLSKRSVDLFQSFIDKHGDFQTVALAVIHTPYFELLESKQVKNWLGTYRDMLNKFKFWEKRAEFDVFKMKLIKSHKSLAAAFNTQPELANNQNNKGMEPLPSSATNLANSSNRHQSHSNLLSIVNQQFNLNNANVANTSSLTHASSSIALNQLVNYEARFNLTHSNQSPLISVNLNCNKCGKNLLHSAMPVSHLQHFLQLNKKFQPPPPPTIANNPNLNALKLNEYALSGCHNCKKFLPQCTICLRQMRVNLTPSPISMSQAQTSNAQILLNRSQSIYVSSSASKMYLSIYPKTNIQFQLKSPNNVLFNKTISNFQSFDNFNDCAASGSSSNGLQQQSEKQQQQQQQQQLIQTRLVNDENLLQIENISFLCNSRYGDWFSWCQTCKHGGHLKHLLEWFRAHEKCPFLHCKCQCLKVDLY